MALNVDAFIRGNHPTDFPWRLRPESLSTVSAKDG